eukprot:CAMPEP_0168513766 /NCGR_PEP_ID=MMETSP0405-20121227/3682_1 /TAXON_ID=498012 /ORGANISM="Trichosphaerium sp, Strain Am-I-7 wt" /LENGTH=330 /DNA_ID=CAMNT_0008532709 /DNA_START=286 /DNA_END=1278 /DNA_ORIENTATION=-
MINHTLVAAFILLNIACVVSVWRPFNDISPWNTPIPKNATIDPKSDSLIKGPFGFSFNHLALNIKTYSIPVYYVNNTVPKTKVHPTVLAGKGFNPDPMVPIPAGATPAAGTDKHMCIADIGIKESWDMWYTLDEQEGWTCKVGATTDLSGSGSRPSKYKANPWTLAVGARACGFPLIAGLIRVEEMKAGVIDHALVFAYPYCMSNHFVYPASTAQGTVPGNCTDTRGIPCGGLVRLSEDFDIEGSSLSREGKIIARAMQKYGAYMGDYADVVPVIYAESSPESIKEWDAMGVNSDMMMEVFTTEMMSKYMKVLTLPPIQGPMQVNGIVVS